MKRKGSQAKVTAKRFSPIRYAFENIAFSAKKAIYADSIVAKSASVVTKLSHINQDMNWL